MLADEDQIIKEEALARIMRFRENTRNNEVSPESLLFLVW